MRACRRAALSEGVFGDFAGDAEEVADGDGFERLAGVFTGDEGLASRFILFGLLGSDLTAVFASVGFVAFLALRRGGGSFLLA